MIHILYLTAGQSRRYGSNKLLEMRGEKPLYRYGLEAILHAVRDRGDCTLTVVTCFQEIFESLSREKIRCVLCPDSYLGISYTIRTGIRSCLPLADEDYLCFAAADQPYLTAHTITRLLDVANQHPMTACLASEEHSGNPVLFSAMLAEELMALEGDKGGKSVMKRHPENHVNVICSERELTDIDYTEKS